MDDAAQEEYEALLAEEGNEEVATMEMTWAETLGAEDKQEGRLERMSALVADLLEHRFGPLSEGTRGRLRAIESSAELTRLFERALEAGSFGEMEL